MQKIEIIKKIEEICPPDTQDEWDNSGVQIEVGGISSECEKVLVALEITDDVISEAAKEGADLIVTHHPLIFGKIASISSDDVTGRYIERLIKEGISCYSYHTPFDKMDGGNNDDLAGILGLEGVEKTEADEGEYLRKGKLPKEMSFPDVIKLCSEKLGMESCRFRAVGDPGETVKSVVLCTGSGGGFMKEAYDAGADLYITGDVKYHDAMLAKALGLLVLDIGHYGSEKIFVENMASLIEGFKGPEVVRSGVDIDPFITVS